MDYETRTEKGKQELMAKAVRLAENGRGWVNPNPMVGAILVRDGSIIGKGYHHYFGAPHAEVEAICSATDPVEGATLVVTLEPCAHHGKTPPCAQIIVEKGIRHVIIGMGDPNPLVNGKGIEWLESHEVKVESGILEEKIRQQNEIFLKFITKHIPFCILKTAMTLDGKIATVSGESKYISGDKSRKIVHGLRHQVSAVMVGIDTILADDPLLNVRNTGKQSKNPLKVIVDTSGRLPAGANVLKNEPQLTILATTHHADYKKLKEIERVGVQIIICAEKNNKVDLANLMNILGTMEIDSVMIEGGSTLAFSALQEKVVDKIISFISPKILGGRNAPTPIGGEGIPNLKDALQLHDMKVKRTGEDLMIEGYL
ncbi:MAG: bifunctional diaminohydroxyphosphoribosylaminopyrimidine deaminase/5-amino-6-(5-phosphoribosylamino)uracil reductase RibD [Bacteroidetes bacterium]|nr:bifunctional diaminohydroxyphosphoribosylaminopyrimidine deaminase/5-amino-6-(5-phosphoribosylamino)uracil reductase RibD [Bacteroidota bacterium]